MSDDEQGTGLEEEERVIANSEQEGDLTRATNSTKRPLTEDIEDNQAKPVVKFSRQSVSRINLRENRNPEYHIGSSPTPLTDATQGKHSYEKILKYPNLFKTDEDGDTILHIAIVHNELFLTRCIVDAMVTRRLECCYNGLDIQNHLQQAPIHLAVLTCQPPIVEYLTENGADVNILDRNGQTALHLACKNADLEDVVALKKGLEKWHEKCGNKDRVINLNPRDFRGFAPIHLATFNGSRDVLEELLNLGADINVKDNTCGRTALHHAVEACNPIITKFLILQNADVNAQTFSGNTPLHTAYGRNMDSIITLLVKSGANSTLTNTEGDTASQLAANKFPWPRLDAWDRKRKKR